ncbi:MAG TPA: tetratricopeptide repeat protein [Myxococcales bacterium]|jgi:tetratricopeptide (TPR) repeat protein
MSSLQAERLARSGEKLLSEGAFAEAAQAFRDALLDDPVHSPARLGMARLGLGIGLPDAAKTLLDGLLAREPKNAEALVLRALVQEGSGELEQAIATLSKAVAAAPSAAFTHYQLGRALCVSGRFDQAVAELQAAARIDPKAVVVAYALGVAHEAAGKKGEAIAAYTHALALDPRFADGYLTLADVLCEVGREDMAAKLLAQGRALLPQVGALSDKLAAVRLKQNDLPGAVAALQAQTAVDPSEEAFCNLATAALAAGDARAAAAAIDRLVADFPHGWRGHHLKSMMLDAADRADAATSELRLAVKLAPEEWRPLNDLGTLLNSKRSPEAVEMLERAARLAPDELVPAYNLALAYWNAGRGKDARAAAEKLLGRAPASHPVAQKAREFLAALLEQH